MIFHLTAKAVQETRLILYRSNDGACGGFQLVMTAYIMPIPETDNQEGFLLGFHSQIGIDVTMCGFKPEVSLLVPLGRIVESLAEPIPQLN